MGEEQTPPPKRSGLTYCLLIGCGLLLLGGVVAAVAMVLLVRKGAEIAAEYVPTADPVQVQSRLDAILPSKIPAGYEGVAMRIPGGWEVVMVAPSNLQAQAKKDPAERELPLVMVVCKVPPGEPAAKVKQDIERILAQRRAQEGPGVVELETPDGTVKQEIVVRGDAVGLEQTARVARDGRRIKQVFLAIPRAKGSDEVAFLMAVGEEAAFDQAAFQAYLDSIR